MKYREELIAREFFYVTQAARVASFFQKNSFDRIRISHGAAAQILIKKIIDSTTSEIRKSVAGFEDYQIISDDNINSIQNKVIYIGALLGKANFSYGRFGWGTLVAFFHDKICTAAAFYEPMFEEMFNASYDHGAFINRRRIKYSLEARSEYNLPCEFLVFLYKLMGRAKKNQFIFDNYWIANTAKLFAKEAFIEFTGHDNILNLSSTI